jgi:hypothetical protein
MNILLYFILNLYSEGFSLRCTMLYTYSIPILLAIWQALYPLGCLGPFTDLQNAKWINERMNEQCYSHSITDTTVPTMLFVLYTSHHSPTQHDSVPITHQIPQYPHHNVTSIKYQISQEHYFNTTQFIHHHHAIHTIYQTPQFSQCYMYLNSTLQAYSLWHYPHYKSDTTVSKPQSHSIHTYIWHHSILTTPCRSAPQL